MSEDWLNFFTMTSCTNMSLLYTDTFFQARRLAKEIYWAEKGKTEGKDRVSKRQREGERQSESLEWLRRGGSDRKKWKRDLWSLSGKFLFQCNHCSRCCSFIFLWIFGGVQVQGPLQIRQVLRIYMYACNIVSTHYVRMNKCVCIWYQHLT